MQKILVTGSEGFIGSHLVETLVAKGYSVRAFVLYNSFGTWGWLDSLSPETMVNVEVVLGDVRDATSVNEVTSGCDVVAHLAALISIPYSYTAPDAFVATNATGTLNVLQAARRFDCDRVLHTSTSEVYGTAEFVPMTEDHPLKAQSPYAATKIAADQLALSYYRSFETPVTVLRPFNAYGPRQLARAVIPTIITQLASGTKELKLGAVHTTRDFTFAKDTAGAFAQAITSEGIAGETINVGSNFEISIADVVTQISKVMGVEAEIISDQSRVRPALSEVERLFADNKKAKQLLAWEPEFGGEEGFARGITQTVEWFSDESNLKQYKPLLYNI